MLLKLAERTSMSSGWGEWGCVTGLLGFGHTFVGSVTPVMGHGATRVCGRTPGESTPGRDCGRPSAAAPSLGNKGPANKCSAGGRIKHLPGLCNGSRNTPSAVM